MIEIIRKPLIFIISVLVLASFVRLYRIEQKSRFIWDEGRDMIAIRRMIVEKNITLFGPYNEIDGKKDFFGVFHYYLMAPSLYFTHFDPIGPVLFTALLGVASTGLVYLLLRQWSSELIARLACVFYAVSPLVVQYVQWSWNPNTLPFFALLYFLCLTRILKKNTHIGVWTSLAGLLLGLLFQLHYFSIPLGAAYLLIFLNMKKRKWKEFVLFSIFFLLPNTSFIFFDLTHDFFYFKILKDSFTGTTQQRFFAFHMQNFLSIPFQFMYEVLGGLFAQQKALILLFESVFFWSIFSTMREYFITRKVDLRTLLACTWILFFLLICFFPSLFNDYHSSYLWFSVFYFLINSLGTKKHALLFYFLLIPITIGHIGLGRAAGWSENLPLLRSLTQIVISHYRQHHAGNSVNIASLTDADTRAVRCRYFLLKENVPLDTIDQYLQTKVLYVISPYDQMTTKNSSAWEISSFREASWEKIGEAGNTFVYKVEK